MRYLILPALIALSACGQDRPVTVLPPAELMQCDDMPEAPTLPPIDWTSTETAKPIVKQRGKDTLAYILTLRSAYASCRGRVDGVREWAEGMD